MEQADIAKDAIGHGSLQLATRSPFACKLKNKNFHQAIVLPESFKSALLPWFARIIVRTVFIGEQRYGLLHDLRRPDPYVQIIFVI